MAAASVIQATINVVYPEVNLMLRPMLNTILEPLLVVTTRPSILIMWSSTVPIRDTECMVVLNHFVPLIPHEMLGSKLPTTATNQQDVKKCKQVTLVDLLSRGKPSPQKKKRTQSARGTSSSTDHGHSFSPPNKVARGYSTQVTFRDETGVEEDFSKEIKPLSTDCSHKPSNATVKASLLQLHNTESVNTLKHESTGMSDNVTGSCSVTAGTEPSDSTLNAELECENVNVPLESITRLNQRQSTPDIGNAPHQPAKFNFPKRKFGDTSIRKHSFQAEWFTLFPWIHYDIQGDCAFASIV